MVGCVWLPMVNAVGPSTDHRPGPPLEIGPPTHRTSQPGHNKFNPHVTLDAGLDELTPESLFTKKSNNAESLLEPIPNRYVSGDVEESTSQLSVSLRQRQPNSLGSANLVTSGARRSINSNPKSGRAAETSSGGHSDHQTVVPSSISSTSTASRSTSSPSQSSSTSSSHRSSLSSRTNSHSSSRSSTSGSTAPKKQTRTSANLVSTTPANILVSSTNRVTSSSSDPAIRQPKAKSTPLSPSPITLSTPNSRPSATGEHQTPVLSQSTSSAPTISSSSSYSFTRPPTESSRQPKTTTNQRSNEQSSQPSPPTVALDSVVRTFHKETDGKQSVNPRSKSDRILDDENEELQLSSDQESAAIDQQPNSRADLLEKKAQYENEIQRLDGKIIFLE